MEPERIAVEIQTLRNIRDLAKDGQKPTVEYSPGENQIMMEQAYALRGGKLSEILQLLRNILG